LSAQEATIYGALIAGVFAILGAVAGLFTERYLRSRGEVSCETGAFALTFNYDDRMGGFTTKTMSGLGRVGRGYVAQARSVEYSFKADFFNARDLPTGLRSFAVLFYGPDDPHPMVHDSPTDARSRRVVGSAVVEDTLDVLNLPPRQLVGVEVRGAVPDLQRLVGCERVVLQAVFPDGKGFSREVARLDPSVVLAG